MPKPRYRASKEPTVKVPPKGGKPLKKGKGGCVACGGTGKASNGSRCWVCSQGVKWKVDNA